MTVNGFELPAAFVQLCEAIERGEAPREWDLKENVDAYGEPWEVADLRIHCDPKEIQSDTDRLSKMFDEGRFQHGGEVPPDEVLPEPPPGGWPIVHGCIEDEDFTGVANFVSFASATDGMVYCFDFGTDPKEPSVVYWEEGYWRRVAPNFETFITLFDDGLEAGPSLEGEEETALLPGEEGWAAPQPSPRVMLAQCTREYARRREGHRPFFEDLASYYAGCNPEERREVEAEVREKLEQMGMTDDQRRTHEELWARLRATKPE